MKRTVTALFLTLAVGTGAAQAQLSDPTTPLPNFTLDNVADVFRAVGAQPVVQGEQGAQFLEIPTGQGGSVFARLFACTPQESQNDCKGLILSTLVDRGTAYDLETINTFNSDYPFIKVYRIDSGAAVLSRYLISDYGMPKGNVIINAQVLVDLTRTFAGGGTGELTASVEGGDVASAALGANLMAEAAAEVEAHAMKMEGSMAFKVQSKTEKPE